jgi:hypothetical protein
MQLVEVLYLLHVFASDWGCLEMLPSGGQCLSTGNTVLEAYKRCTSPSIEFASVGSIWHCSQSSTGLGLGLASLLTS